MHIGLIASPFISVPPPAYGGTELFVADLAHALVALGVDVTVYTNGESTVNANIRWLYPNQEWPLASELAGITKEIDHTAWAMGAADQECDIIHVNSAFSVSLSRLTAKPAVCTLHHPFEQPLADLYARHEHVSYIAISGDQARHYPNLLPRVIHHGIDLTRYTYSDKKEDYLCFLGRICPVKGTHNAIEIARRCGLPLKIAGEVQPVFRDYFDTQIKPHIDGKNVEFLGPADLKLKNELFRSSKALLFPIEWDEPFGLVMIEAMACGTPVIAFPGGAVEEVVKGGVSGRVCSNIDEAVDSLNTDVFRPHVVRNWAEKRFSAEVMARRYCDLYSELLDDSDLDPDLDAEEAAA